MRFSQLSIQSLEAGSLKLAMVEIFTPWKFANPTNQTFFFFKGVSLPAHTGLTSKLVLAQNSNTGKSSEP